MERTTKMWLTANAMVLMIALIGGRIGMLFGWGYWEMVLSFFIGGILGTTWASMRIVRKSKRGEM